jgi:uncharacterized protein YegL
MGKVDYSANPNQRTPCVLVLDASSSMNARPPGGGKKAIDALNEGLRTLNEQLREDDTALTRIQLAIVSVGGPNDDAEIMMGMTDATNFKPFELQSDGTTPLGKGIQIALDLLEETKSDLRSAGISYTRPWMMVISDGYPTDTDVWEQAAADCRQAEADKEVKIYPIAVEGADLDTLAEISAEESPIGLQDIKFDELFKWLSNSLSVTAGGGGALPSMDPWRNVRI